MKFTSEEQIFSYIQSNEQVKPWIADARKYSKDLLAVIDGENFEDHLIHQIEHLENKQKAKARKKYSRDIKDFYTRLLRPIDNIWSSTGGISRIENLDDNQSAELQAHVANVKGNKTLLKFLENTWQQVYHTDPNGIIMLEYDAMLGIKPRPSYKSINMIRDYISNGQMLEVLLFEPKNLADGVKQWTVVDDEKHYTVIQKEKSFQIIDELTFAHEFGVVPALINSDIEHIGYDKRLSPVDAVVKISEEYARDLSVKTIYKFQQGFPKHWRYTSSCPSCDGLGKDGEGNTCGDCSGTGELFSRDVTNEDRLTVPEEGQSVIAPASGYVNPALEYLADTRIELKRIGRYGSVHSLGSCHQYRGSSNGNRNCY